VPSWEPHARPPELLQTLCTKALFFQAESSVTLSLFSPQGSISALLANYALAHLRCTNRVFNNSMGGPSLIFPSLRTRNRVPWCTLCTRSMPSWQSSTEPSMILSSLCLSLHSLTSKVFNNLEVSPLEFKTSSGAPSWHDSVQIPQNSEVHSMHWLTEPTTLCHATSCMKPQRTRREISKPVTVVSIVLMNLCTHFS
jgi:hypothetical protein